MAPDACGLERIQMWYTGFDARARQQVGLMPTRRSESGPWVQHGPLKYQHESSAQQSHDTRPDLVEGLYSRFEALATAK